MADEAPRGLDMSLDAIIQEKSHRKRPYGDETNGNHGDSEHKRRHQGHQGPQRTDYGTTRVVVLNRHRAEQETQRYYADGPRHPHDEQVV